MNTAPRVIISTDMCKYSREVSEAGIDNAHGTGRLTSHEHLIIAMPGLQNVSKSRFNGFLDFKIFQIINDEPLIPPRQHEITISLLDLFVLNLLYPKTSSSFSFITMAPTSPNPFCSYSPCGEASLHGDLTLDGSGSGGVDATTTSAGWHRCSA
jgi:hypothetical protein